MSNSFVPYNNSRALPDAKDLEEILSYLNCSDRETWYKTFAILGRAYHCDERVFNIAQQWARGYSQRDEAKDSQKETTEFYVSSQREGPGIGALILQAQKAGYQGTRYNKHVHEHEAPISALVSSDIEISIQDVDKSAEAPERKLFAIAESAANRAIRFWLFFAADNESTDRLRFLNEHRKYFRFMPRRYRLVAAALLDYCSSHPVYGPNDFAEWCKAKELEVTPEQIKALTATDTIPETVQHTWDLMQEMYRASWMLLVIQQAKTLANGIAASAHSNLNDAFERADNSIENFANQIRKVSEDNAIDAPDWAVENRKSLYGLIDVNSGLKDYVPSGYPAIDRFTLGYRRREVTLFAAHSGVGKTWFGLDSMLKVAVEHKARVLFISTEMATSAILDRCFALINDVSIAKDDLLSLSERGVLTDMLRYADKVYSTSKFMRVVGCGSRGIDITTIEEKIMEASFVEPLDLVVVDYLQNVQNSLVDRRANSYERNKDTMERLTAMAARYNCAILALAQLNNPNRKQSPTSAPNLYDIAECSYVVQPAASVLMMHRVLADGPDGKKQMGLRLSVVKSRYGRNTAAPLIATRSRGSRFDFQEA